MPPGVRGTRPGGTASRGRAAPPSPGPERTATRRRPGTPRPCTATTWRRGEGGSRRLGLPGHGWPGRPPVPTRRCPDGLGRARRTTGRRAGGRHIPRSRTIGRRGPGTCRRTRAACGQPVKLWTRVIPLT
ncbi:hypothetical protein SM8_032435 [Streptomyces sp. SM8]|nr:hypothetical protein SM8_032435 [Streptomyces sp. SM8]